MLRKFLRKGGWFLQWRVDLSKQSIERGRRAQKTRILEKRGSDVERGERGE